MHILTDADDNHNVNDNSDMSLALDVLLSEYRGCPTEVSCCCSVGFSVDFEKYPVSVHVGHIVSLKAKDASSDVHLSRDAPLRGTIRDRGPVFRLPFANR